MTEAEIIADHNKAMQAMTVPQVMAVDRLICAALLSFQMEASGKRATPMDCLGQLIRREAASGAHLEPNMGPKEPKVIQ